jgi:CMP-N-acetylneuraminic acid synthetase
MNTKALGIIPARGGSKGLPDKNIIELAGKPLLAHTIELIKECDKISDFVVSTESSKISEIARQHGAQVLRRPENLSKDTTSMADVIRHVAEELPHYDLYVTLYPTVPFRSSEDVDNAVEKMIATEYESLVSITPVTIHPYGGYSIEGDDLVRNIKTTKIYRRQDMKPLFQAMGGPYIVRKECLNRLGDNMYTDSKTYHIIPNIRSVDIDDRLDLMFAEFLLEKGYVN